MQQAEDARRLFVGDLVTLTLWLLRGSAAAAAGTPPAPASASALRLFACPKAGPAAVLDLLAHRFFAAAYHDRVDDRDLPRFADLVSLLPSTGGCGDSVAKIAARFPIAPPALYWAWLPPLLGALPVDSPTTIVAMATMLSLGSDFVRALAISFMPSPAAFSSVAALLLETLLEPTPDCSLKPSAEPHLARALAAKTETALAAAPYLPARAALIHLLDTNPLDTLPTLCPNAPASLSSKIFDVLNRLPPHKLPMLTPPPDVLAILLTSPRDTLRRHFESIAYAEHAPSIARCLLLAASSNFAAASAAVLLECARATNTLSLPKHAIMVDWAADACHYLAICATGPSDAITSTCPVDFGRFKSPPSVRFDPEQHLVSAARYIASFYSFGKTCSGVILSSDDATFQLFLETQVRAHKTATAVLDVARSLQLHAHVWLSDFMSVVLQWTSAVDPNVRDAIHAILAKMLSLSRDYSIPISRDVLESCQRVALDTTLRTVTLLPEQRGNLLDLVSLALVQESGEGVVNFRKKTPEIAGTKATAQPKHDSARRKETLEIVEIPSSPDSVTKHVPKATVNVSARPVGHYRANLAPEYAFSSTHSKLPKLANDQNFHSTPANRNSSAIKNSGQMIPSSASFSNDIQRKISASVSLSNSRFRQIPGTCQEQSPNCFKIDSGSDSDIYITGEQKIKSFAIHPDSTTTAAPVPSTTPPVHREPLTKEEIVQRQVEEEARRAELEKSYLLLFHAKKASLAKKNSLIIAENSSLTEPSLARKRAAKPIDLNAAYSKPNAFGPHPRDFYIALLEWDYSSNSDSPSNINQAPSSSSSSGVSQTMLKDPLAGFFSDYKGYFQAYAPMILHECWHQILQTKQEIQQSSKSKAQVPPSTRTCSIDLADCNNTAVVFKPPAAFSADVIGYFGDSHFIELQISIIDTGSTTDLGIQENDILVLWRRESVTVHATDAASKSGSPRLARVKNCQLGLNSAAFAVKLSLNSSFRPGTSIIGMHLCSSTTSFREYSALCVLQNSPMLPEILNPHLTSKDTTSTTTITNTSPPKLVNIDEEKKKLKRHNLNDSQTRAVLAATATETGFSLIQGPPGTGKTKTVIGLLEVMLLRYPRVLVCAPSNVAVDGIIQRALEDGWNAGEIIRIGSLDSISPSIHHTCLDPLVQAHERRLEKDQEREDSFKSLKRVSATRELMLRAADLNDQLKSIKVELNELLSEQQSNFLLDDTKGDEIALQIAQKRSDEKRLHKTHRAVIEQQKRTIREANKARHTIRKELLKGARLIASTLSGAGSEQLSCFGVEDFKVLVVDEAAQAVEPSCIIPFRFRISKCFLVGDPNQLPPTVLSSRLKSLNYDRSLFSRVQAFNSDCVGLLEVQYRMHPDISIFSSREFYDSRLRDGISLNERNAPWHTNPTFGTFRVFNFSVGGQQQSSVGKSLYNRSESKAIVELLRSLFKENPRVDFRGRVGVITPYRNQSRTLSSDISQHLGHRALESVEINTVDGFQGKEKDIIIISCVRSHKYGSIGFLADIRRLNVALTRARFSLWIVGNVECLEQNPTWQRLFEYARGRGFIMRISGCNGGWAPETPHSRAPPEIKFDLRPTLSKPSNLLTGKDDADRFGHKLLQLGGSRSRSPLLSRQQRRGRSRSQSPSGRPDNQKPDDGIRNRPRHRDALYFPVTLAGKAQGDRHTRR